MLKILPRVLAAPAAVLRLIYARAAHLHASVQDVLEMTHRASDGRIIIARTKTSLPCFVSTTMAPQEEATCSKDAKIANTKAALHD